MVQGTVFNIQRYSIHDGPGIRTTVFLKGCPLTCWWCHNPESQELKQEIIYNYKKCIGCGDCINICSNNAIVYNKNRFIRDRIKCNLCGKCAETCPTEAIEMIGRKMTVEEVMKEIEKDMVFYEESGGGVTFSGGEPLMQPEFLESLLDVCKEKGIHTALDTSGYGEWGIISKILKKVDLFLYDIKHIDNDKHMKFTGVSNELILSNLKRLVLGNAEIWIRIPVIPEVNDDEESILEIGKFVLSLNLEKIFLLPYHNIAADKYKRLGRKYNLPYTSVPKEEQMIEIARKFKKLGLKVKIGG